LDECKHELKEGKEEHISTIRKLCRLGCDYGFTTFHRYRTNRVLSRAYLPVIDLLWAIDMKEESMDYDSYLSFMELLGVCEKDARYLPFVSFEVESSDPTSKVVSTDLMNLLSTHSRFSFLVINKNAKGSGSMSVKRAEAIVRTFNYFEGYKSVHVIDSSSVDMLDKHEPNLSECRIPEFVGIRQWRGPCEGMSSFRDLCSGKKLIECLGLGNKCKLYEDTDDGIRCLLSFLGWKIGLLPCYRYKPTEVLPSGREATYHVPKIDTVLFLQLNRKQKEGITKLLSLSNMEKRCDACHIPLFGMEIEGGQAGKHSIGGIVSLSRYAHYKILITKKRDIDLKRALRAFSLFYGKDIFSISSRKMIRWARDKIKR